MASSQQPAFQAYRVIKREGQDDYWLNVGAAFEHQDGNGYNVVLQAIPIDGKIVLRPPKHDADDTPGPQAANDESTKRAVRQANDRRRGRS